MTTQAELRAFAENQTNPTTKAKAISDAEYQVDYLAQLFGDLRESDMTSTADDVEQARETIKNLLIHIT